VQALDAGKEKTLSESRVKEPASAFDAARSAQDDKDVDTGIAALIR